ncbi:hypothetical protein TCDM_07037 [Trypanosoma cruzi Dm28c]|uniref:Uncharacterized protein n=1 Tax=Trypanosoma cruzi Dm28c TaxID=1416333 RepID=V5DBD8_TRYCR|nr:hypothetical protein TCDM_07037 [Trypanosoma cruzi Dm28c]
MYICKHLPPLFFFVGMMVAPSALFCFCLLLLLLSLCFRPALTTSFFFFCLFDLLLVGLSCLLWRTAWERCEVNFFFLTFLLIFFCVCVSVFFFFFLLLPVLIASLCKIKIKKNYLRRCLSHCVFYCCTQRRHFLPLLLFFFFFHFLFQGSLGSGLRCDGGRQHREPGAASL